MQMQIDDAIKAIQNQIDVSTEVARAALERHQHNITEAILDLYQVPPLPEAPKNEWDERREICRAYEETMDRFFKHPLNRGEHSGETVVKYHKTSPP